MMILLGCCLNGLAAYDRDKDEKVPESHFIMDGIQGRGKPAYHTGIFWPKHDLSEQKSVRI